MASFLTVQGDERFHIQMTISYSKSFHPYMPFQLVKFTGCVRKVFQQFTENASYKKTAWISNFGTKIHLSLSSMFHQLFKLLSLIRILSALFWQIPESRRLVSHFQNSLIQLSVFCCVAALQQPWEIRAASMLQVCYFRALCFQP